MKIRSFYVSNSSSSSFIVLYGNEKGNLNVSDENGNNFFSFGMDDFLSMIYNLKEYCEDSTSVESNGIENVSDSIKRRIYDGDDEQKFLDSFLDESKKYDNAAEIRISYSDKFTRDILDAFIKSGKVKLFRKIE